MIRLRAIASPLFLFAATLASHASAQDAGKPPPTARDAGVVTTRDAGAAAPRDGGADAASTPKPASTAGAQGSPHGGESATGNQNGPADTVEEDDGLPFGSIEVEIRDPSDQPRPKVPVMLGIVMNSVAKGEDRKHVFATTNDAGKVRWDKLEGGSQMAYRVSVTEGGAQFAARPFQLDPQKGMRVVLHTYPVVNDLSQALVVMQSIIYVELKDDRVQIQQAFNIFNFGKTAWAPRDFTLPLPEGFSALTGVQQMSDQSVEAAKTGARIKGTFTPGRHALEYKWQLPYSQEPSLDFAIGMPPNVAAARVMVVSAGEMRVAVDGFPTPRPARDGQGNAVVETERELRRDETSLKDVRVQLTNIPTPGIARNVAAGIAALGVALGLSFFRKTNEDPSRDKRKKADRKAIRERLLAELEDLERARRAGDIGPRTYENARREIIDAIARTLATEAVRS